MHKLPKSEMLALVTFIGLGIVGSTGAANAADNSLTVKEHNTLIAASGDSTSTDSTSTSTTTKKSHTKKSKKGGQTKCGTSMKKGKDASCSSSAGGSTPGK